MTAAGHGASMNRCSSAGERSLVGCCGWRPFHRLARSPVCMTLNAATTGDLLMGLAKRHPASWSAPQADT